MSPDLTLRGKRGKWAFRWPTSVVTARIVRFTCFAESGRREPPPGVRASRRYRPSQNWFSQFYPKVFRPGGLFYGRSGERAFSALGTVCERSFSALPTHFEHTFTAPAGCQRAFSALPTCRERAFSALGFRPERSFSALIRRFGVIFAPNRL